MPLLTGLAFATFLWTNRRFPDRSAGVPVPSRIRAGIRRMAERQTQDDPELQAGFFFALQTLTRSAPHRTIMAMGAAVGLTHALVALAQSGVHAFAIRSTPPGVFGIAILLLLSLVAAVFRAVTVPAEPAASWAIRMAWLGDERAYLAGVKRAGMAVAAVALALLLPLHIVLLGPGVTMVHSLFSMLFATTALDALFLPYRRVPFACSYVPLENPKVAWPAGLAGLLLITYGFAGAERFALQTVMGAILFGVSLVAIALLVRAVDRERRRERRLTTFDDRPAPATQPGPVRAHRDPGLSASRPLRDNERTLPRRGQIEPPRSVFRRIRWVSAANAAAPALLDLHSSSGG